MQPSPQDLAQTRLDNALALFEEFVRTTARHADAATLRGLERRFAERLHIQPSYWSQIKSRSRQIGERLARQFENLCHKPAGWMDQAHGDASSASPGATGKAPQAMPTTMGAALGLGAGGRTSAGFGAGAGTASTAGAAGASLAPNARGKANESDADPRDADERFIVGLVLTYYRRHPQRARTRLLDLLGEVLTDPSATAQPKALAPLHKGPTPQPLAPNAENAHALWLKSQSGVAPLKRKR
jgi:hypothetical protein